jgi:hypothetical protein
VNEDELYDAFGIEPEESGEPEGQEPAEGQTETPAGAPEGGEGQGVEPEEQEPETAEEGQAPEGQQAADAQRFQEEQRQQLAQRQRAEAERRSRQAAVDEAYRNAFAGQLNPYTNQPITSKADYDAYLAQKEQERAQLQLEQMKQNGIDPQLIQRMVNDHPAVKQAGAYVEQMKRQQVQERQAQAERWFVDQLKEIQTLDPSVKGIEDLSANEGWNRMLAIVRGGGSLADAYRATNYDKLTAKAAAAGRQTALNEAAGKGHLDKTGVQAGAAGGVEVPTATMDLYREMFPDLSDAEIRKEYAKTMK